MSAEALVQELHSRGVQLIAEGDRIRYRAPQGVLTAELKARLHEHKGEVLAALRAKPSQPTPAPACPADQLDADWQRALATACQRFEETGVEPDQPSLEAGAWLELQFSEGWRPRQGITEEGARRLLEAVYAGRLVARINDDARVVLSEPVDCQQARLMALEGEEE